MPGIGLLFVLSNNIRECGRTLFSVILLVPSKVHGIPLCVRRRTPDQDSTGGVFAHCGD